MFPTFTQAIANTQCPFDKNIAFIDEAISWAAVVDIDRLYVTANFLMNVRTYYLIKWRSFKIYSGKRI